MAMLGFRTKMGEGGRVVIPAQYRKALHLAIGSELVITLQDNELHLTSLEECVKHAQEKVRRYNKEKKKLTEILSAQRKEDALNE